MSPRRAVIALLAAAAACALALAAAPSGSAAQDAPPDSVRELFRQLADSTDAAYGEASVAYDTTGLDSLTAFDFGALPPPKPARRRGLSLSPILRFHRTEGPVLGAGATFGNLRAGVLHVEGSYGFGNEGGRYAARWRKPLFVGGRPLSDRRAIDEPRIVERRTELDFVAGYARSTLSFMPEHARSGSGSARALLFGSDRHSVYESRGFNAGLVFWGGDWRLSAGWEDGRDRAMERVTRFSLFGNRDSVIENLPAAADRYHGPTAGIAWARTDWELAGRIDVRAGGEDRWRVRSALGKALRLGSGLKAYAQAEAGATAALAPLQRRFEVGGPRMLPTLHVGTGAGDHLVGGKLEFVSSVDVLRSIGIGGPDWLILNPYVTAGGAALWNDAGVRNVVFASPPSTAWRGWAGAGFVFRPGIPDPDTWVRIGYVKPIGPAGGFSRVSFSIDRAFDLVGKL